MAPSYYVLSFHICIQNLEQKIDFMLTPDTLLKNEMFNYLYVKDGFKGCTK